MESEKGAACALSCKPLALSHMKPRGPLAATVLTKGKTLPEGSADLEILKKKKKLIFRCKNVFETYFDMFVKMGL